MAGVTEVLRVCEMAQAWHVPVAPHAGEMSQVHLHVAYAHTAITLLEYIPWIKDCFAEPAEVVDGHFLRPQQPGASTTPTPAAWELYAKPVA